MATCCLVVLATLLGVASASGKVEVINLPVGFQPEGITFGRGWTGYVGSIFDGAIWKGNLKTGEGEVVLEGIGTPALGLAYDKRSDYLYVGGSTAGTLRVYDRDVNLVKEFSLVEAVTDFVVVGDSGAVNDLDITDDYVYITDSLQSQFYKVPLNKDGSFRDGDDTVATTVPISGDGFPPDVEVFVSIAESVMSNGIVASDDGSMLIIAVFAKSELYLVDAETGDATLIDLGGEAISGDGMVRRRNTLWVVSAGFVDGLELVYEIALSEDWTCGKVTRIFDNDLIVAPSTAALKNNDLYVVNARFFTPENETATQTYEVVVVDRDESKTVC